MAFHASGSQLRRRGTSHIDPYPEDRRAKNASAPTGHGVCKDGVLGGEYLTHLRLVLFRFRFNITLIHIRVPLDVGETVHSKCVFGVEWVSIHRTLCERSIVRVFEINENKALRAEASVRCVR